MVRLVVRLHRRRLPVARASPNSGRRMDHRNRGPNRHCTRFRCARLFRDAEERCVSLRVE
jgi:hypothetical protein